METQGNLTKVENQPDQDSALPEISQYKRYSLFQIVQKKKEVLAHLDAEGGELNDETERILDMATELLEKKVDGVCSFLKCTIGNAREVLNSAYRAQMNKIDR